MAIDIRDTGAVRSLPPEAAESEAADPVWTGLKVQLENLRRALAREIRAYPPPIAGCDQQFNLLLERRDRVTEELGRLAILRRAGPGEVEALSEFIGASLCLDDELKTRLLADLNGRVDKEDVLGTSPQSA